MYFPSWAARRWAAGAHLSAILTLGAGLATHGWGAAVALLLPAGLYFYYRERSPFVAYHALQALTFQAASGLLYGLVALAWLGLLAGHWLLTAALSALLVGWLLTPWAALLTALAVATLLGLPMAALILVMRGGYLAWQGELFEYPGLGGRVGRLLLPPWPGDKKAPEPEGPGARGNHTAG